MRPLTLAAVSGAGLLVFAALGCLLGWVISRVEAWWTARRRQLTPVERAVIGRYVAGRRWAKGDRGWLHGRPVLVDQIIADGKYLWVIARDGHRMPVDASAVTRDPPVERAA